MKKIKNISFTCYLLIVLNTISIMLALLFYLGAHTNTFHYKAFLNYVPLIVCFILLVCCSMLFILKDYLKVMSKNAYHDVTGVHNKQSLEKKIQQLQLRSDILNVGVMMFDLNNLKRVNDTYGHEQGDIFIRNFAAFLTRILTANSYLARYGGDEFIIIQEHTSLKQLAHMDFQLQSLVNEYNLHAELPISYAVGYDVSYKDHYFLMDDLIQIADKKMYKNKQYKKAHLQVGITIPAQPSASTNTLSMQKLVDNLYSLPNREGKNCYAIVLTDINNFRFINDTYGYETGDEILDMTAKCIETSASVLFSYRFHSDLFVSVIRTEKQSQKETLHSLKQENDTICNAILQYFPIKHFSISSGVYFISDTPSTPAMEDIISHADIARRQAKHTAQHILAYSDELARQEKIHAQVLLNFQDALANGEFQIHFQPKVSTHTLQIHSAEVLIRWKRDGKVVWTPDQFISILEQSGDILELDYYVYEKTFQWLNEQQRHHRTIIPLSLNVSPVHFEQPELFLAKVNTLMEKYHINPKYVIYEITEQVFIHDPQTINYVIRKLHEKNIRISMDDFVSGYSSLNMLKDILFDEIKIDKEFLSDNLTPNSRIVLQEIFHMLKRMKKSIVCEGVETKEISDFLIREGCDELQGFLYYKPMDSGDMTALLKTSMAS